MTRIKAVISGRVQGVGFRYFVIRSVVPLELTGYAMNLGDGNVEVVAEGERSKLEELIEVLNRGPSFSSVSGVNVDWSETEGRAYKDFTIRY